MGCFFLFKQKTAYEMRISDWSSDVCSSDLRVRLALPRPEAKAMFDATESGLASLSNAFTDGLHDGSLRRYLAVFVATTLVVGGAAFLGGDHLPGTRALTPAPFVAILGDRKSVVSGKSVSVRVVAGGRRIIKIKKQQHIT